MRRAILLDESAYAEVRDDKTFTTTAAGLAALTILINGLGAFFWAITVDVGDKGQFFSKAFILGDIFLALLWLAGVAVIYLVLTQAYHQHVVPDALFRICAVSFTPFSLGFLVLIPGIGFGFGLLSVALVLFYTVFGVRAAYPEVEPLSALVSVVAGIAVWTMILPILTSGSDPFAPGVFVFEWSEDVVEDISSFRVTLSGFLGGV